MRSRNLKPRQGVALRAARQKTKGQAFTQKFKYNSYERVRESKNKGAE